MNPLTPPGFRSLAVLSMIFHIAASFVDMVFPSLLPVQWQQDIASASQNLPLWMQEHLFVSVAALGAWFLAWSAGFIGLLFFKRWGRSLSLYSTFVPVFFLASNPVLYSSGLSSAFAAASYMLWGSVLALSYYSPIAERFKAP